MKPTVTIDSREEVSSKAATKLTGLGVATRVEPPPCGDYLVHSYVEGLKPVLVERKTITDLAESAKTGKRLWKQLEELKAQDAEPVLLLEGWLGTLRRITSWSETAIIGVIDAVQDSWGVKVVPSADFNWALTWLARKAKKLRETLVKKEYALRPAAPREAPLSEYSLRS